MHYFLAVLFGAALFVLFQLNGVFNKADFSWKIFFKTNIIPFVINIVAGFAVVFVREDITELYPVTTVTALMLGLGGQAIIKKLANAFNKKLDTKIGLS